MVEDMENKIRSTLNEIYFGKTKDIGNGLRSIQSLDDQRQQAGMKQELAAALVRRNVRGDNWNWARIEFCWKWRFGLFISQLQFLSFLF